MLPRHVIVQAGGKGTRMGKFTVNKPKCLISINGRPMLYALGNTFKGAKFYIITDYKSDVLDMYMKAFPPDFDYELVKTTENGTCAGIKSAIDRLPERESFMIVWSDLNFDLPPKIPEDHTNYIGTTNKLTCRWRVENGIPIEDRGNKNGIIGLFQFTDKAAITDVPKEGEFVKFLKEAKVPFEIAEITNVKEFGTLESYENALNENMNSRFFNSITVEGNTVTKTTIDKNFLNLEESEIAWYKFVTKNGYPNIPKIKSFKPLKMEYIKGIAPYKLGPQAGIEERKQILNSIFNALDMLHEMGEVPAKQDIIDEWYISKTIQRIGRIKQVLPESNTDYYIVNGQKVTNLLNPKYTKRISEIVKKNINMSKFCVIHGDPTFSNTLIEENTERVVFIDPRGYFGSMKIYGDEFYDWSKLYYSVVGNYDNLNSKKFDVKVKGKEIDLKIQSAGWESLESMFEKRFKQEMKTIKVLHALIWLALSGYVIDDLDSIYATYFNSLKIFQDVWDEYG